MSGKKNKKLHPSDFEQQNPIEHCVWPTLLVSHPFSVWQWTFSWWHVFLLHWQEPGQPCGSCNNQEMHLFSHNHPKKRNKTHYVMGQGGLICPHATPLLTNLWCQRREFLRRLSSCSSRIFCFAPGDISFRTRSRFFCGSFCSSSCSSFWLSCVMFVHILSHKIQLLQKNTHAKWTLVPKKGFVMFFLVHVLWLRFLFWYILVTLLPLFALWNNNIFWSISTTGRRTGSDHRTWSFLRKLNKTTKQPQHVLAWHMTNKNMHIRKNTTNINKLFC